MKTIVGFFEVEPGVRSAGRLIYIIGMISTIVLNFGIIYLKATKQLEITWTELGLYDTILFGIFTSSKLYANAQENASALKDVQDSNLPKP
jgi:hypothetical protein